MKNPFLHQRCMNAHSSKVHEQFYGVNRNSYAIGSPFLLLSSNHNGGVAYTSSLMTNSVLKMFTVQSATARLKPKPQSGNKDFSVATYRRVGNRNARIT